MIVDPLRQPIRGVGRAAALALVAALSLTACIPGGAQPSGSPSPTSSSSPSPSASPTPSPSGGTPAETGTASAASTPPAAPTGDAAPGDPNTFVASPPPRIGGSAPDTGACVHLKEASVRAALGSAAPATLTPFAREDRAVEGVPGAVARECTMELGPEPGHTVSVVVSSFPDAASANAYGVVPRGFTADRVSGLGDLAAFLEQGTPVEVGYYLFIGRGTDIVRFRLGLPKDSSGAVAMDAPTARDALVRLAEAAGL